MKLITRHYLASTAAARWKEKYCRSDGQWNVYRYGTSQTKAVLREVTYQRLVDLGPAPSPDDVDRIISEDTGRESLSWTDRGRCDECEVGGVDLVQIGQEPDYDSRTAYICLKCLVKALELIDS